MNQVLERGKTYPTSSRGGGVNLVKVNLINLPLPPFEYEKVGIHKSREHLRGLATNLSMWFMDGHHVHGKENRVFFIPKTTP